MSPFFSRLSLVVVVVVLATLHTTLCAPFTGEQYCHPIQTKARFDSIRKTFRYPLQKYDGKFSLLGMPDGWWIDSPPASSGQVGVNLKAPTNDRYAGKVWVAELKLKENMGTGYFYLNNGEHCYINDINNVALIDTVQLYTLGGP